jgi:hypothetical protein
MRPFSFLKFILPGALIATFSALPVTADTELIRLIA